VGTQGQRIKPIMWQRIKQRLQGRRNHGAGGETGEAAVAAAAVLLQLMARADYQDQAEEQAAARRALMRALDLPAARAEAALAAAARQAGGATDLFSFTRTLNRHLSRQGRVALVEALWVVAYADGVLDKHERHLMRRLADLLHVSHRDYIAAKMRARAAAGGG